MTPVIVLSSARLAIAQHNTTHLPSIHLPGPSSSFPRRRQRSEIAIPFTRQYICTYNLGSNHSLRVAITSRVQCNIRPFRHQRPQSSGPKVGSHLHPLPRNVIHFRYVRARAFFPIDSVSLLVRLTCSLSQVGTFPPPPSPHLSGLLGPSGPWTVDRGSSTVNRGLPCLLRVRPIMSIRCHRRLASPSHPPPAIAPVQHLSVCEPNTAHHEHPQPCSWAQTSSTPFPVISPPLLLLFPLGSGLASRAQQILQPAFGPPGSCGYRHFPTASA
ncbi:hypothetical protein EV126DRAFT_116344 [Verticillium dahliae]|nr:hypothetical protein EV126DRAFT_116344 [Verticillium dahliae]